MMLRSPLLPVLFGLTLVPACGNAAPETAPRSGPDAAAGSSAGGSSAGGCSGSSSLGGLSASGTGGSIPTAGTTAGTPGMAVGAGGAAGASGGPQGGGGSGGAAGGSGGSEANGLCSAGNCSAVVGDFDGFVWKYPCAPGGGCKGLMCVDNELTVTDEFTVMGDAATVYLVEFRVRGVTESKNYTGGERRSKTPIDPGPAGGNLWYEGGTAPDSSYGALELHVTPPLASAPNDYYLNARDGTDEHDGTTWALDYSAAVKVTGGGKISFRAYDSNCDAIRNCGPRGTSLCTPRTLDLSDAVPATTLVQPVRDANMTPPQWLHIDVTSVVAL